MSGWRSLPELRLANSTWPEMRSGRRPVSFDLDLDLTLPLRRGLVPALLSPNDAVVTVVSRFPLPEMPRFDPVADLDSFFAGYPRSLEELAELRSGQRA
jgi:hypothetical protein